MMDQSRGPGAMDAFQLLPTELLVEILKRCPDFTCLWSLINASPDCLAAFGIAGLDIIEALINTSAVVNLQFLMRAVVCLCTGIFDVSLSEDQKPSRINIWTTLSKPLPRRVPYESTALTSTLRAFVRLGYRIHGLAHFCLRQRFESCRFSRSNRQVNAPAPLCALEHPLETTSWLEQTRMVTALWHLQFEDDMTEVRRDGRLSWANEDTRALPGIGSSRAYLKTLLSMRAIFEKQEIKSAVALLANLGSSHFRQRRSIPDVKFEDDFGRACPTRGEHWQDLWQESFGVGLFSSASSQVGHLGQHWVATFHRYGIPFWEKNTLHKLGLCTPDDPRPLPDRFLDLLSNDERHALRRELARCDEPGWGPVYAGL